MAPRQPSRLSKTFDHFAEQQFVVLHRIAGRALRSAARPRATLRAVRDGSTRAPAFIALFAGR